ncbi:MAG: twin-arginine translocase TatA/TatE family subunit [Desulfopila sp.]
MFGIGLPEMILILGLALIVVGPDKLPELARSLAKGIMELKKTAEGFKEQLREEGNLLDDVRPDLEDAAKTLKKHMLEHPDDSRTTPFESDESTMSPADLTGVDSESSQSGGEPNQAQAQTDQENRAAAVLPADEREAATTGGPVSGAGLDPDDEPNRSGGYRPSSGK